jgi:hypothetical protein
MAESEGKQEAQPERDAETVQPSAEQIEAVEAIREGLSDLRAGWTVSLEKVRRRFQTRNDKHEP